MKTFAERLKIAIAKKDLSQAEAARICGIAQQSLNYIITNNLLSSKLAPRIASALKINPEWLILGQGKFEETKIYEIPLLHSSFMVKKFLNDELDVNAVNYTIVDVYLGDFAFAYLFEAKKIAICSNEIHVKQKKEYLNFNDTLATVSEKKGKLSFPVFEWRIRSVDF